MKKMICTSTVKYVAHDPARSVVKTFTVEDGDWCRLNRMIDAYARDNYAPGELFSISHLAHGSFVVNDY